MPRDLKVVLGELSRAGDAVCWNWPYAKNGAGRATWWGRSAPRVIYESMHGPLRPDLYVCHTCDNPACVNPSHFFIGTQKDNMRDCRQKGRANHRGQGKGEAHSLAKLNEAQALEVIRLRRAGVPCKDIASRFGIGRTQAERIANGKRWGHLQSVA